MPHTSLENIFVGREDEEKQYQEFLQGTSPWVFMITGQPGTGKSALLRRYISQTPRDVACIHLDFSNDTLCIDAFTVLERCAEQLETDPQVIATFEQALAQARGMLKPPDTIHQSLVAEGSAQVTDVRFSVSIANEQRQRALALAQSAFLALVNTLHEPCLVMLLDTCERLQQMDGNALNDVGKWLITDLLPRLHDRLARRHRTCLIVTASRFALPFENIPIHELCLPFLKEPAVEDYLQQANMNEAILRQKVYELTHGHALCVAILAKLWQERGNRPFPFTDIPILQGQFTERALLKFIGERILNKRLQTPFYELTRYGILLRSFDFPLLQAVFPELHLTREQFEQMKQYPYVESQGKFHYALHDLLREIQAGDICHQEPEKWQMYHQRALDYYSEHTPDTPILYYHMLALHETAGFAMWSDIVQETQLRGERDRLTMLLQVAHDKTLELSPLTRAYRAYWQGRFSYFGAAMQTALASYEQALDLFRQVGSKLGEANVRKAIGDVQQFRKDMQAALASYEQALDLFRQVGDRLGEANVRKAIGDVQQFRKDMQAALASYEQALDLFRQVGDRLGEANVLQAIGDVQQFRDEREAALASYEQALDLFRQVGDRLGEANVRKAIGDVQQFRKDMQSALASYEQALDLFRQVGDRLGEANVRKAIGDVQQFRKDMQTALASYEQALDLFRQVGDRLGEANVRKAIGDVQQFRDEREAALASYEQALDLFRQVGSKLGEANVLQAIGDVQQFRKDMQAALASYEQALDLFRQVGDRLGKANCYHALGLMVLKLGKYDESLQLFTESYQLYQDIQDSYSQARLLYYRSFVYEARAELSLALTDIETAFVIAQHLNLPLIDLFQQRLEELHNKDK
jgi:tetratricopeptide (TPR) repeat protein